MPKSPKTMLATDERVLEYSERFLIAIYNCLVSYWIKQGVSQAKAESGARKAIIELQTRATTETWCLIPE